jgi:predicted nicotinamide N-methyase
MTRKIIREAIQIMDKSIQIERIANMEDLFDELLQKDSEDINIKDERIPYWCEIWASAIGLSMFIIENKTLFGDKSVIEIGAGLGLPGITASWYAPAVTITDYIEEAVQFSKRNWMLNHQQGEATFETLDWRHLEDNQKKFDIVMASDVAYERAGFDSLLNGLKKLLNPGGYILLSEPNRYLGKLFLEKIADEKLVLLNKTYTVDLYQKQHAITVYQLFVA